ncbi:hypothetical protein DERP_013669 [Dermatophagoides pteronyssinus]|uniref:Serine/threonine-protein kinase DDB_G0282963 n=1 Tax=Dermatophagoides pteronyssinus TaxID=6956 RepID=A0ABQ8JVB3_DERPT|nr:hypothetical protein DERP_013669 [Dermatophagoides pteronyssinus]
MQTSTSFDGSKFPLTFSTTFVNAGVPGPSSSSRGSNTTTTTTNSSMAGTSKSSNFIRDNIGGSGGGIINPIFIDPLVQIDEFEQNDCERELETFPTPPPPPNLLSSPLPSTSFNQPKTSTTKPETIDRTDSASNLSGSTVITNASSTGGLLSNSIRSSSNNHHHNHHRRSHSQQQQQFNNSFHIDCPDCQQFHHNHHRIYVQHHNNHKRPVYLPITPITSSSHHHSNHNHPLSSNIGDGYAPYPPQWYYLLAADTKKFRKHRHTHYRRDCRQCREIVRSTFEQYYLRAGQPPSTTMGQISSRYQPQQQRSIDMMMTDENSSPDSIGSISLDYHQQPYSSSSPPTFLASSPTPSSLGFYSRSRASCGHSCLKFTILFYCCIAVIMAICFICYLTKMFGLMAPTTTTSNFIQYYPSSTNYSIINDDNFNSSNESILMDNNSSLMIMDTVDPELPATTLLETIRTEMIGLIIASAFMIIFILGLIGAFLESILCLRIFGAILSYLFLLTFGSALYIVILLIISHVPLKLILSTISCAAVAVTIHGLLAIAPFAFADLISEERNEKLTEAAATVMAANSTYFKYPSVRFFSQMPIHSSNIHHHHSKSNHHFNNKNGYFGFTNPTNNNRTNSLYPTSSSQQTFYRDTPIESIPTSDESIPRTTPTNNNNNNINNQGPMDNISSEELIPSMNQDGNELRIQSSSKSPIQQNSSTAQQQQQTVRFTDNWM